MKFTAVSLSSDQSGVFVGVVELLLFTSCDLLCVKVGSYLFSSVCAPSQWLESALKTFRVGRVADPVRKKITARVGTA